MGKYNYMYYQYCDAVLTHKNINNHENTHLHLALFSCSSGIQHNVSLKRPYVAVATVAFK